MTGRRARSAHMALGVAWNLARFAAIVAVIVGVVWLVQQLPRDPGGGNTTGTTISGVCVDGEAWSPAGTGGCTEYEERDAGELGPQPGATDYQPDPADAIP